MSWTRHEAVIVTTYKRVLIDAARDKAIELGFAVTDIVASQINEWYTFLIAPDGSKEGWDDAVDASLSRARWVYWARDQAYEDGSTPLQWAVVHYGETVTGESAYVQNHAWDSASKKHPRRLGVPQ